MSWLSNARAQRALNIVSGGNGSELYRVTLPDDYVGLSIDEVSARLRADHRATLLSIGRAGATYTNPPTTFGWRLATMPWWWPNRWARLRRCGSIRLRRRASRRWPRSPSRGPHRADG